MAVIRTVSSEKRKKKRPAARGGDGERPAPLRRLLTFLRPWLGAAVVLALVIGIPWALFGTFRHFYYDTNPEFLVDPADISIYGNTMLSRDVVLQAFGLTKPVNGFGLTGSDDIIRRLSEDMPLLKRAHMTFEPKRGVELWVEERVPLARLAGSRPPMVVDEEGAVFFVPRSGGYPEIGGFDLTSDLTEPGAVLPANLRCMLSLLSAEQAEANRLPSRIVRVTLVGNDPEDGLTVLLADGCRILIAWPDMERSRAVTPEALEALPGLSRELTVLQQARGSARHTQSDADDRMVADRVRDWERRTAEAGWSPELIRRLQELRTVLQGAYAEGKRYFNATVPGRIGASE